MALVSRAPDLSKPGCYVLRMRLSRGREIRVGRLGTFFFRPGEYFYVGSARGGLARRLARYFRRGRALRWHIDYLLQFAKLEEIWYSVGKGKEECRVSRLLQRAIGVTLRGFASSDCNCQSHLYQHQPEGEGELLRLQQATGSWHRLRRREFRHR